MFDGLQFEKMFWLHFVNVEFWASAIFTVSLILVLVKMINISINGKCNINIVGYCLRIVIWRKNMCNINLRFVIRWRWHLYMYIKRNNFSYSFCVDDINQLNVKAFQRCKSISTISHLKTFWKGQKITCYTNGCQCFRHF